MARLKTYLLAAGTIFMALAIGFVMQNSTSGKDRADMPAPAPVEIGSITDTSSAVHMPRLPTEAATTRLPDATIHLAAAQSPDSGVGQIPAESVAGGFDCAISVTATPNAGAMVDLDISAPCYASERLTVHHNGLMITEVTQPDGTLSVAVPALAQKALFIVDFDNGKGMTAMVDVPTLAFYDRVALQWRGESGLQLHAREFDARNASQGHVWAASAGDMSRTARGEGGFLTRLGAADSPDALVAEIYSFPAGTAQHGGHIALSIEAEITAQNCNSTVEAQTLELRGATGLRVRDLTLDMPDCAGTGDFLLLKNLIEDLTIASN